MYHVVLHFQDGKSSGQSARHAVQALQLAGVMEGLQVWVGVGGCERVCVSRLCPLSSLVCCYVSFADCAAWVVL